MSIIKKCPVCQKSISIWAVVKPGIWDPGHSGEIICKQCNQIVSRFWNEHYEIFYIVEMILSVALWFINPEPMIFFKSLIVAIVVSSVSLYVFIKLSDWGKKSPR